MHIQRRTFLRASLGASALASFSPGVSSLLRPALRAQESARGDGNGRVLVILELAGGNDGLNCVVPHDDDHYARRRSTLRLAAPRLHPIDEHLGFHPEMRACHRLFVEGRFSIVQGVGYTRSSRNHEEAKRDWATAHPGDTRCDTGWLGRAIDRIVDADPTAAPAARVGSAPAPLALVAECAVVPALEHPAELAPAPRAGDVLRTDASLPTDNPLLRLARVSVARSAQWADRLARAADPGAERDNGRYPPFRLAARLRTIARLIRAGVGFSIFHTELGGDGLGGFDTHANQKENHAALLRQFSESVAAFLDDLRRDRLDTRVALVTVSEFGRTLTETGRGGTNHGAAAPVFLAGGALAGGLIGAHPALDDLDADAPKPHTDFRRVYATALEQWLGIESAPILGARFDPLPLFRA